MPDCPRVILDYWRSAFEGTVIETQGDFTLSIVSTLSRKGPAMMLEGTDGSMRGGVPTLPDARGKGHAGTAPVSMPVG